MGDSIRGPLDCVEDGGYTPGRGGRPLVPDGGAWPPLYWVDGVPTPLSATGRLLLRPKDCMAEMRGALASKPCPPNQSCGSCYKCKEVASRVGSTLGGKEDINGSDKDWSILLLGRQSGDFAFGRGGERARIYLGR
jgi:hypothetical protein